MAVSLDVSGGIAVIRIDEPSDTVLADVRALLPVVAGARAVVLLVDPGLCAADTGRLVRGSVAEREAVAASLRGVRDEVANLPVPVVAAIGGSPSGEAAELAMACDLRVLAADGGLGWVTGGRVTGDQVLVARRVTADEALRTGLVDRVVPRCSLLRAAVELANECKSTQAERKSCRIVAP
ncbi:enoyl-CoA hydratase/isomerase family protein [Saccharothrix luteola]|uniref:enoyl-CoA hydratase/isomerase family protein n=1 Tax=Saccharothrix luteola TaxID=2893018 RepID=UPI001E34C4E9|nr:enoyl-CoA hydratase/isomerase family protein [Saccharothrix luteola]MCC8247402.1 enoyl-CoA hydratase/isomerase family protein [Saccharothrix luteola]